MRLKLLEDICWYCIAVSYVHSSLVLQFCFKRTRRLALPLKTGSFPAALTPLRSPGALTLTFSYTLTLDHALTLAPGFLRLQLGGLQFGNATNYQKKIGISCAKALQFGFCLPDSHPFVWHSAGKPTHVHARCLALKNSKPCYRITVGRKRSKHQDNCVTPISHFATSAPALVPTRPPHEEQVIFCWTSTLFYSLTFQLPLCKHLEEHVPPNHSLHWHNYVA